jgi:hypothetical protein
MDNVAKEQDITPEHHGATINTAFIHNKRIHTPV